MSWSSYYLACALADQRQLSAAQDLHSSVIQQCLSGGGERGHEDPWRQELLAYAYNGLGVIHTKQKQWQEALDRFGQALKLHAERGDELRVSSSLTNIGMCQLETGELQEAQRSLSKALEMVEELYFGHLPLEVGHLLTNLGLCYRRLNDLEKAEALYKRSLEVKATVLGWDHNDLVPSYYNLSAVYSLRNLHSDAEQQQRKALSILQNNGQTLDNFEFRQATENLITSLINQKRFADALSVYRPLYEKLKEPGAEMEHSLPGIHWDMARYLLQLGETREARDVACLVMGSSGIKRLSGFIFVDQLQLRLSPEEKMTLRENCTLQHALTLWPGNPDVSRQLITQHALPAGDVDWILQLQAACAEHNPQWGMYSFEACADWCQEGGNLHAAVQVLQAGLDQYPDSLDSRVHLMDLCRKGGLHSLALPHLPLIVQGRGQDPACLLIAGDVARHGHHLQMALQLFERVAAMDNPQLAHMAQVQALALREALEKEGAEDSTDRG